MFHVPAYHCIHCTNTIYSGRYEKIPIFVFFYLFYAVYYFSQKLPLRELPADFFSGFKLYFPPCSLLCLPPNLLFSQEQTACLPNHLPPFLCRITRISEDGVYTLLTGMLCGYPMGTKTCSDFMEQNRIHPLEGRFLFPSVIFQVPCSFLDIFDLRQKIYVPYG